MPTTLEAESTLTNRYQTTIPETVRRALNLGKRDKIHYSIRINGKVVLTRAEVTENDDPVLGQFLDFLANDLNKNPDRIQAMDSGFVQRLQSLTQLSDINLNAPLPVDDN